MIAKFFGERKNQKPRTHSVKDPLPVVTSHGAGGLVSPYLMKYCSTGGARSVEVPVDTITTKDRFGLVTPLVIELKDGNLVGLDIHFRMLTPRELARAMSFPDSYQFSGNREAVVKQIGNAVNGSQRKRRGFNHARENRSQFRIFESVQNGIEVRNLLDVFPLIRFSEIGHEATRRETRVDLKRGGEYRISKRDSRAPLRLDWLLNASAEIMEQHHEVVLLRGLSGIVGGPCLRVGRTLGNFDGFGNSLRSVEIQFALKRQFHSNDVLAGRSPQFKIGAIAKLTRLSNTDFVFLVRGILRRNEKLSIALNNPESVRNLNSACLSRIHETIMLERIKHVKRHMQAFLSGQIDACTCRLQALFTIGSASMEESNSDEKNPDKVRAAQARSESLTPSKRSAIARKAAIARWDPGSIGKMPTAERQGVVQIGGINVECYVLDDGRRLIHKRGMAKVLGMKSAGGNAFMKTIGRKGLGSKVPKNLSNELAKPIVFKTSRPDPAHGYEHSVLVEVCDAIMDADRAGLLTLAQRGLADRAQILIRSFAKTALVALIDEATGFQYERPQNALQAYLALVIRKELAAWVKRFPDEFYENIYKLKGWPWPGMQKNRISVIGTYTKDLVYQRIGPEVLKELERKNPKDEKGYRKNKHHQWLTEEIGHPLLSQHLHALIMFQRLALTRGYGWNRFVRMVDEVLPRRDRSPLLPGITFDEDASEQTPPS